MCIRHSPPVVGKDIEDAQHEHKEGGRPFGFKADCDHYACGKTNDRHKYPNNAPFALQNEAQEEEDQ